MQTENTDIAMKQLYKKMMTVLMSAIGGETEEAIIQLTNMRDALSELIDEIKNGDVIIAE